MRKNRAGFAAGDINIDAEITWSSNATLTLSAFHSVNVNAAIIATEDGTLDIRTNNDIKGTSSGGSLNIALGRGDIQFTTQGEGALDINGTSYMLIWTVPELQDVGTSGDCALATNIDAASFSGFGPLAEDGFTGVFNGLGNTISDLVIDDPVDRYVGLFSQIGPGGVVQDIRLIGGSDTGSAGFVGVGALAGKNEGTIIDAEAEGKVTAVGNLTDAGGLVGDNTGTIENSRATPRLPAMSVADSAPRSGRSSGRTRARSRPELVRAAAPQSFREWVTFVMRHTHSSRSSLNLLHRDSSSHGGVSLCAIITYRRAEWTCAIYAAPRI